MNRAAPFQLYLYFGLASLLGCASHQLRPSTTAVGLSPANQCDPEGIPYYLPKALLVVAKNMRHIDEGRAGMTATVPIPGGFDSSSTYADVRANVTVPDNGGKSIAAGEFEQSDSAVDDPALTKEQTKSWIGEALMPSDGVRGGIQQDTFFTYQIIFVPDLNQKYGLRISGGAGEVRATMNLINGWMYTGMGPFYLKDSSSAQNAMAKGLGSMFVGRGMSGIVDSVGALTSTIGGIATGRESGLTEEQSLELNNQMTALQSTSVATPTIPQSMLNYAEMYIYEPILEGDQTRWALVAEHHFDRDYLEQSNTEDAKQAREQVFGMLLQKATGTTSDSPNSPPPRVEGTPSALPPPPGTLQTETVPAVELP